MAQRFHNLAQEFKIRGTIQASLILVLTLSTISLYMYKEGLTSDKSQVECTLSLQFPPFTIVHIHLHTVSNNQVNRLYNY